MFYWSFAEFGMAALAHEEVWGTVCICRHTEHGKLDGGVSALFHSVLSQFFGQPHDIRLSGCSVTFPNGQHATITAQFGVLLADMPALSECISCKGHSGTLCCPCCTNAVQQNSAAEVPVHALSAAAVSIANTSLSAFTAHTDESIRQVVRRVNFLHGELLAHRLTQEEYKLRSSVLGWNWSPANIVLNERFRVDVASCLMYDWAHVYVHGGLADTELGQCMKVFYSNRCVTSFKEMGEYVATFALPKKAPNPEHLFSKSANANNAKKGSFSCTGSELLTLAPILHRYFTRVVAPRGEHMENVKSIIAVLTVVTMLISVRSGTIGPDELFAAITEHLQLYVACYGADAVRPKHHYALHLPSMLARHGFLLSTFIHERKHRLVTRYGRDRRNLKSFDGSALEDITAHQLWELARPFLRVVDTAVPRGRLLIALREVFPDTPDGSLQLLNNISGNGGRICTGDVVSCLHDGRVQLGELLVAVGVHGPGDSHDLFAVVSFWQAAAMDDDCTWQKWLTSKEHVAVLPLAKVDTVFTHRMASDGQSCIVFLPFEVRPK